MEACTYNPWAALSVLWLLSYALAKMNYFSFEFKIIPSSPFLPALGTMSGMLLYWFTKIAQSLLSHYKLDVSSAKNCCPVYLRCIYNRSLAFYLWSQSLLCFICALRKTKSENVCIVCLFVLVTKHLTSHLRETRFLFLPRGLRVQWW